MFGRVKHIFFLSIIILVVYFLLYNYFASSINYEESRSHLLEIYSQMEQSYSVMVSHNWNVLDEWEDFLQKIPEDDGEGAIRDFIHREKEIWKFTEFYFLDDKGNYITESGKQGAVKREEALRNIDTESQFMGQVWIDGECQVLFAIKTLPGTYYDFAYSGIGMCYSNAEVNAEVDARAFQEDTECYLIYPDGQIMFSSNYKHILGENIVSYMTEKGKFKDVTPAEFRQNIREDKVSVEEYEIDGISYYITCQPLSFQEGMILGIVPTKSINSKVVEIRRVSTTIVTGVFTVILMGTLLYLHSWNKGQVKEKDIEIENRDKLFKVLTDQTDDMYIIFSSKDFKAQYISPNIERVLGLCKEQIADDIRNLIEIVSDDKVSLTKEILEKIDIDSYWEAKRSIIHQKTGERWVYKQVLYHSPSEDDNEEHFIMVLSDRTKESHITEQLAQALQETQDANEAKSSFLFNMSHDLRTPMNAIVGLATLLSKEINNPDKIKEYADKILMSSRNLFELINNILDMSKIENGKLTLSEEVFRIPELLKGIVTIILPQTQEKGQKFAVRVEGVREEYIVGDRVRLQQILLNLLSNAVKYTQEKGRILLKVIVLEEAEKYQRMQFIVQDNGAGMTQEFQNHIFEPFVRMHENSSKIQGTGLGMAIVKNLVDVMGGTISVESRLGEGSIFTVDLNLGIQKQPENTEFWQKYGISRMLLIDDEEEVRQNIQGVLENTGIEIDYAAEANQAVSLVQQAALEGRAYDVVVTDWEIPDTDGIEIIQRIRKETKQPAPILLLMALNWRSIEQKARSAGADGFLFKPFFASDLEKIITDMKAADNAKEREAELKRNRDISGIHFLVVEDYEINREILVDLLHMEGASCETAVNGAEGVEMFEQSSPGHFDMILMDVQMPVMNGYEACMRIRAGSHPQSASIPIIAMTANAFEEDVKKALQSGMNAHVAKPVDMNRFKDVVNQFKKE